jgi:hypothetical protein
MDKRMTTTPPPLKNTKTKHTKMKIETALQLHQIYSASLVLEKLNAAFELDKNTHNSAGGNSFFVSDEGDVSFSEARRLAYEGKFVALQIDHYFYRNEDKTNNRSAYAIFSQLETDQEGTGDGDGFNILSERVNFNRLDLR